MKNVLLLALTVASVSACDAPTSSSPPITTTPVQTTPASIRLNVASRTDQQLDITATVLTSDGHFVSNVAVNFTVGAGTIAPATMMTDANGTAKTIANTPSQTNVTATAGPLSTSIAVLASAPSQPVPSLNVVLAATSVTVGTPTTLSVLVTGGTATSYLFSFGDGSPDITQSGASVAHLYAAGSYAATVTVTDTLGRTARGTTTVLVTPSSPPPPPALTVTLGCSQALNTSCNVSAADETGAVVTSQLTGKVTWDFGDGSAPVVGGALNTHPYPQSGTYTVVASATIGARSGSARKTVITP